MQREFAKIKTEESAMKNDVLIASIMDREKVILTKQTELIALWIEQGKELQATNLSVRDLESLTGISKSRVQRYKAIANDKRLLDNVNRLGDFTQNGLVALTKKSATEFKTALNDGGSLSKLNCHGAKITKAKEPTDAENLLRNWNEKKELYEHFKHHEAITKILDRWYANDELMTSQISMRAHAIFIIYDRYPLLTRPLVTRRLNNEILAMHILENGWRAVTANRLFDMVMIGQDKPYSWKLINSIKHSPNYMDTYDIAC